MKNKRWINKFSRIALSWCLLISMFAGLQPVYADGAGKVLVTVPQAMNDAAGYIMAADGNALTDWDAYALAKAAKPVPASYLSFVSIQLQQNGGAYGNVTDYDRVALGVKSSGGNPEQVTSGSNSYNLIQSIYNSDAMTAQGTNGAIYSLLALSSGAYTIPLTAKWTPNSIVAWLLAQKNTDGGWPLAAGGSSSVDITAAAVNALSAYKSLPNVQQAIDGGIQWLSSHQLTNGGFSEYGENSESTAQVILALSTAGIDAGRSPSFTKANGNPLSYLFSYRQGDGGFAHVTGSGSHTGATGQALMALAAYQTFTGGNSGSYDAVPTTGGGAPSAAASVTVHVAGPTGNIAESAATSSNAYDAVIQVLRTSGISYHEGAGHYIDAVNGISSNYDAYWLYNVKRQGSWDYASTNNLGLYDYQLRNGDEIYLYFSGYDTSLVKSITVSPAVPVAGQALQVAVTQSVYNWVYSREDVTVASGVYVELGAQKVQTDSQGIASFPSGLPSGTYKTIVTSYRTGMAPRIVTDSTIVAIGSTTTPNANPVVSLSVIGDSSKGAILSSTSVSLHSVDTPYSILNRTLGAGRVQSSGSGSTAYVQGIDGLREFDRGPLSGWMYAVNGSYLSTGADSVFLKSGDTVAWRYTLDGGKDLNAGSGSEGTPASGVPAVPTDPAAISDVVQMLGLAYNNQKPIDEITKPAVVLNADKIMTADAADTLKKNLAANTVNVEKIAAVDSATVIADAKAEIKLQIPAGALKESTGVTVSELSSERSELVSSMYEFGPAGLTFEKPIQISIQVPIAAGNLDQLALVWLNERTGQWIPIPAVIDAETGVATGLVNHFTKFAVIDKSKLAVKTAAYSAGEIGTSIKRASDWLKGGAELSDWSAYALSRAGVAVSADYLASVEAQLKEKNGTFRKVTDYERLALCVQAAGGNPEAIGGFNIIESIYNNERMEDQGSNSLIYGLLALNGGAYRIPADAKWTAEKLLQRMMDVQNADGSWALMKGDTGNPDLTAAALAALSPYKERAVVKHTMDKAVKWLGSQQSEDGGFALDGAENAESTAQVLWGLSVSGNDPVSSPYFNSGNNSMLAYLLGLQLSSGAFPHIRGGNADAIATEQALMALGAYQAFLNPASVVPSTIVASYSDQADIASWALPFVQKASVYRIVEGTGGTVLTFEPKKTVTRIQFAVMLLRILGEAPAAEVKAGFADVAPDSWYAGYVTKAVAKGIVDGVSADHFAPDSSISRQEMAIMLARALHVNAAETNSARFIDLEQAYPGAVLPIQAVQEKGLMEGDDSGRFLPLDSATREMAAVVAVRAYELTKKP